MSGFILLLYFLVTLAVGIVVKQKSRDGESEFFLAGRNLRAPLLFITMAATNFSAFTIFGLSGAGYRMGYAFFPVMGYGTGFMALSFFLVGTKIQLLSRQNGFITPGDFISFRYGSPAVRLLFTGFLILFTLPYIAIQTIAGAQTVTTLTGMPYLLAAVLLIGAVTIYVSLGGLRSIAWTDLLQGVLILGFTVGGFLIIIRAGGGFSAIHTALAQSEPGHLARPGTGNALPPGIWAGYFILWFFADPMFPHLFQRFMAAKDQRAITVTAVLYPLVTTLLFFLTVSVGVMGRHLLPGLDPSESDTIFPRLLLTYAGPGAAALVMTGGIAALMSTLDSQLLTVTSLFTREIKPPGKLSAPFWRRIIMFGLAAAGLLIAAYPPETILSFINATTFNGLAVLAPVVIGGLYWKRGNSRGALWSIATGEAGTILFFFQTIQIQGVMPILVLLPLSTAAYILGSLSKTQSHTAAGPVLFPISKKIVPWIAVFALLLAAGFDFWNWGKKPSLIAGLPGWVWYFIILGPVLAGAIYLFTRNTAAHQLKRPGRNQAE